MKLFTWPRDHGFLNQRNTLWSQDEIFLKTDAHIPSHSPYPSISPPSELIFPSSGPVHPTTPDPYPQARWAQNMLEPPGTHLNHLHLRGRPTAAAAASAAACASSSVSSSVRRSAKEARCSEASKAWRRKVVWWHCLGGS